MYALIYTFSQNVILEYFNYIQVQKSVLGYTFMQEG
jgi:hypothetical protein